MKRGPSSPISGVRITTIFEPQSTVTSTGVSQQEDLPKPHSWDDLPVAYRVLICFGQWMTILNSRVDLAIRNGHLNINLDDGCFKS